MECFTADLKKFVAGALYLANKLKGKGGNTDFYRIFKIMFFADQMSLPQHYQTIFGDWYALPRGPVPEKLYHLIKAVRDGSVTSDQFSLEGVNIIPKTVPDMDEFSESDFECLDKSVNENWALTFNELEQKSHGPAWENTATGSQMNILEIARDGGASDAAIEYLKEKARNCSPSTAIDSLQCQV